MITIIKMVCEMIGCFVFGFLIVMGIITTYILLFCKENFKNYVFKSDTPENIIERKAEIKMNLAEIKKILSEGNVTIRKPVVFKIVGDS